MDLQLELIIDRIDLRSPARETLSFTEHHRQAAAWDVGAVFALAKHRRDLRIQTLRDAVADRSRSRRDKSAGASCVDELDGMIVDVDARFDIAQGKIAMNK